MTIEQRNRKPILAALLAVTLVTGSEWSIAADKPEAGKPGMSMHGGQGVEGMKGKGGMMEMMDMMGSCDRAMKGRRHFSRNAAPSAGKCQAATSNAGRDYAEDGGDPRQIRGADQRRRKITGSS